jgi:CubicO group peptidase (beta-lactamase class C family)
VQLKGIRTIVFVTLAVASLTPPVVAQSSPTPTDAEIRQILADRVDKYRQSVGIVVGVIDPQGRRVIAHGKLAADDSRPLDGDTVFEIGSITKVFTSLLLTDMVQHHELELTDPAAKFLPMDVHLPERNGERITLQDLAAHTSGLPRVPTNVDPQDPSNPYADYSVDRLYEFLATYELPRNIGSRFEYSNLGEALLGHVLAGSAQTDYERLVETRITMPLGMKSTHIALTPEMKQHLAVGHAYGLEPTPNWDLGALAAAAALRSSTNDLLTLLAANLGYVETPLAPAMASMMKTRRVFDRGEAALGWFIDRRDGKVIVFHDGSTGGYRSFIGYDAESRVGVVVLSNSGAGADIDDIGRHVLDAKVPVRDAKALEPPKVRKEIAIDSKFLDRYAGEYQFQSGQSARITRNGSHLFLQAAGDVKLAFYPESTENFFAKIMDAQITFMTDSEDHVVEFLFHRNGATQLVKRVE